MSSGLGLYLRQVDRRSRETLKTAVNRLPSDRRRSLSYESRKRQRKAREKNRPCLCTPGFICRPCLDHKRFVQLSDAVLTEDLESLPDLLTAAVERLAGGTEARRYYGHLLQGVLAALSLKGGLV